MAPRIPYVKHGRQCSVEEFVERATKAALKKRPKPPGTPANLRPGRHHLLWGPGARPDERQCRFIKRSGERCKSWTVRGATLCASHGGQRQNPEGKAAQNLVTSGKLGDMLANTQADRFSFAKENRPALDAVTQYTNTKGVALGPVERAQGVRAFLEDDGGRAWRNWCVTISAKANSRMHGLMSKAKAANTKLIKPGQKLAKKRRSTRER